MLAGFVSIGLRQRSILFVIEQRAKGSHDVIEKTLAGLARFSFFLDRLDLVVNILEVLLHATVPEQLRHFELFARVIEQSAQALVFLRAAIGFLHQGLGLLQHGAGTLHR